MGYAEPPQVSLNFHRCFIYSVLRKWAVIAVQMRYSLGSFCWFCLFARRIGVRSLRCGLCTQGFGRHRWCRRWWSGEVRWGACEERFGRGTLGRRCSGCGHWLARSELAVGPRSSPCLV